MTSLGARATTALLRLLNRRKIYASVDGLLRGIAQTRRVGPARPSVQLTRALNVVQSTFDGRDVYRLRRKGCVKPRARILYLHGGAYVRPITRYHWRMLAELVELTNFEFVVPLCPLAPESSGLAALRFALDLYRLEAADGSPLLLMGDSAGAGLAVALAAALRDGGQKQPERVILITPWMDVELTHPDVDRIAPSDPMLAVVGAREAGRLYAGTLATSHPSISPGRGNLSSLPPMSIFVGTRDISAPDTLEFARKASSCGCQVDLRVSHDMIHVWPLMGFAEARNARRVIASIAQSSIRSG